jgi:hypothetical protein
MRIDISPSPLPSPRPLSPQERKHHITKIAITILSGSLYLSLLALQVSQKISAVVAISTAGLGWGLYFEGKSLSR